MFADADSLSAQSYFPLHAIRMAPLDPQRQYIFGWHPHGILVLSRIFCYGGVWEHLFPGLDFRVLGATPMFFVPFCRDICLVGDTPSPAKPSATKEEGPWLLCLR
jgi:hypothetical protein